MSRSDSAAREIIRIERYGYGEQRGWAYTTVQSACRTTVGDHAIRNHRNKEFAPRSPQGARTAFKALAGSKGREGE